MLAKCWHIGLKHLVDCVHQHSAPRNIISSFAWISQFTSLAVSDCWDKGSQKALCAADISDMVAAVTNGPAAGIATTSDCADLPDPLEEEKHLPMD